MKFLLNITIYVILVSSESITGQAQKEIVLLQGKMRRSQWHSMKLDNSLVGKRVCLCMFVDTRAQHLGDVQSCLYYSQLLLLLVELASFGKGPHRKRMLTWPEARLTGQ